MASTPGLRDRKCQSGHLAERVLHGRLSRRRVCWLGGSLMHIRPDRRDRRETGLFRVLLREPALGLEQSSRSRPCSRPRSSNRRSTPPFWRMHNQVRQLLDEATRSSKWRADERHPRRTCAARQAVRSDFGLLSTLPDTLSTCTGPRTSLTTTASRGCAAPREAAARGTHPAEDADAPS